MTSPRKSPLVADPQPGDILTSFRGEQYEFVRWDHYKIVARPVIGNPVERTFYAGVLGVADPRLAEVGHDAA